MNLYKAMLRSFFSGYVSILRKRRGLTQEQMAEKLRITGRAYSDLERGIYCFSAIALVFLLLMLEEEETKELLSSLRDEIKKQGLNIDLEVDGGINYETAPLAVNAGATVLVAGSCVFSAEDMGKAVADLKNL